MKKLPKFSILIFTSKDKIRIGNVVFWSKNWGKCYYRFFHDEYVNDFDSDDIILQLAYDLYKTGEKSDNSNGVLGARIRIESCTKHDKTTLAILFDYLVDSNTFTEEQINQLRLLCQ